MSRFVFVVLGIVLAAVQARMAFDIGALPWQKREAWVCVRAWGERERVHATNVFRERGAIFFYDRGELVGCMVDGFAVSDGGDTVRVWP